MSLTIVYPTHGRGAFPASGAGGTLNYDGSGPGSYYRAPTKTNLQKPGTAGALAVRFGYSCWVDQYAVYSAVKVLQTVVGVPFAGIDGILGVQTTAAIKAYQLRHNLMTDGVIGPKTCKAMFKPLLDQAAYDLDQPHAGMLIRIASGTVAMESAWDPGAVGVVDPRDVGLGQINGPAHPIMSMEDRLNPKSAIPWIISFIDTNLHAFGYDEDAAIAAYNLGVGGAKSWIGLGRPQMFHGTNVWDYVARIKAGG